jgi:hypothetical protein
VALRRGPSLLTAKGGWAAGSWVRASGGATRAAELYSVGGELTVATPRCVQPPLKIDGA